MEKLHHYKHHLFFWSVKILIALLLLSMLLPFAFRFIPPPFSMMMVYKKIAAVMQGESYSVKYNWTALENIDPSIGLAVIAAEDQTFMEHHGFDFRSIWKTIRYRNRTKYLHGASTITQQTAKNLFLVPSKNLTRKVSEAYLAILLELIWPKERILEMYLNIAEFGEGVYGVKAAAKKFFYKTPDHLNSSEAALLAAVLPNPHQFHVNAPSGYVLQRQQSILAQMNALGGVEAIKALMDNPARKANN